MGIYKIIDIVGTSTKSYSDAAKNAVLEAGKTVRKIRRAEGNKFDVKVEQDKSAGVYRITAKIAGEPINYKQHLLRCDVKTAQSSKIEKKGKTYEAKVILGI